MITLCTLALSLPLALALPASQTRPDPDLKELATYTLSMDTLHKVDRAMRSFAVEIKKDPKYAEATRLEAELKALEKKFQEQETEPSAADLKRGEAIEARLEVLKGEGSMNMSDAQTINDMAAKIQKLPAMAAALQREGLTARDFAKFTLAILQAGLAAGLQKAGMLKQTPEGTNPANIKWILEHEAELAKFQKAWGEGTE
jgi:hypothetical protein